MEIRYSRYNAPFCEPPLEGVHFISLDDQRLMAQGLFTSHVDLYRSLFPESQPCIGMYRSLHPAPSVSPDFLSADDLEFLDQLYYDDGIQAAGLRTGRFTKKVNQNDSGERPSV